MPSKLLKEVWNKFVNGEDSCFYQLFKGYYKGLYAYGVKLCNQPDLVEDCIQELFQNIWERRNDLTHITSPNVYLYVSLRRRLFKEMSKAKNFKVINHNDHIEFSITFGVEELIISNESKKQQREELKDALNQLSNRQKEVIYLHFYNGMSYSEIEEILSINRQSIRNHMYRAMERLRNVLNLDVMRLVVSFIFAFLFFI